MPASVKTRLSRDSSGCPIRVVSEDVAKILLSVVILLLAEIRLMQFSRGDKGFQQNGSGFSRQLAAIMAECLSFFINFGVVTD